MFETLNHENLLYLDIETTPIAKEYNDLSDLYKSAWEYYCKQNKYFDKYSNVDYNDEQILNYVWKEQASLIPEFSQIICVSIGDYQIDPNDNNIKFKTWTRFLKSENDNEKLLLSDVQKYINQKNPKVLVAHNGKDFDYPFLIRRFIINDIKSPKQLEMFNKKPWEIEIYDTKEIWRFNSNKTASLISICAALNIPSSKNDIDGSMIYSLFYGDNRYEDLKRIARYCSNDVRAMALIIQKFKLVDNPSIVLPEIKYV